MAFQSVRFCRFRNLKDLRLDVDAPRVVFVGPNGQGKTNFLESVHLLCYGSSFRTRDFRSVAARGSTDWSVGGQYRIEGMTDDIQVIYSRTSKELRLNERRVRDRKDLFLRFPCIAFSHEDLTFVRGPLEKRRLFFDQVLCLCDEEYLEDLRKYRRILRSRNEALRKRLLSILPAFDVQLAVEGIRIRQKREELVSGFNALFSRIFDDVFGESLGISVEYRPSWKYPMETDDILKKLEEGRETDLALGITMSGPHRDIYRFACGKSDFLKISSTGQTRLISLVLRSVQARYLREKTGKSPILLLDDVLLELDQEKRDRFVRNLPDFEQAFFTFLPDEPFERYLGKDLLVYNVLNGDFS